MRSTTLVLGAAALLAMPAPVAGQQAREVPFCNSRDSAELLMQARQGQPMPDGCRTATVRQLDTPAGPLCAVDIGTDRGGIAGAVRDAVATTEWWTPCANLRVP
ncbi:MAG TPA: hypothetical protein VGN83_16910 [Falsiroseomonas sp.]|jgi:hypothetical protein|nr:hypothetical protein [Falsiroseomonas sp.]